MSKVFHDLLLERGELDAFHAAISSFFVQDHHVPEYDAGGPSMTRQEFAEECDINSIMARYEKTGVWPYPENGAQPVYYDFTEVPTDLMTSMDYLLRGEQAFMSLPAVIRKEFDNDPVAFVNFASDKDNLLKLREWGLAEPEKPLDAPIRVEVVPAPGAPVVPPPEAPKPV